MPETIKRKLLTLKTLFECYNDDKLEATNIFLEIMEDTKHCQFNSMKKVDEQRLLYSYQEFI